MGGLWSIEARDLNDLAWQVCLYSDNGLKVFFKSLYCLFKYDVVIIGKHDGRKSAKKNGRERHFSNVN